jgi:hypothetical protein
VSVTPRNAKLVYYTTGFSRDDITELSARIFQCHQQAPADAPTPRWPPILGLYKSLVVALIYLRRNRVQVDLAETFDVSQPTISRAITGLTAVLGYVLRDYVPLAEDLNERRQYIVDGTLLPCWSWKTHPELYSGKHKTTGKNIQVACTHDGDLAWISDAVDGSWHDSHALRESGVMQPFADGRWIADKAYIGMGMLTPTKKPKGGQLTHEDKAHNRVINRVRAVVERVIANLKTWRILHTDYRRPVHTFEDTINTVIALQFYKLA